MNNLRNLLKSYVWEHHLSLRDLSQQIGINFSSLSRFINSGKPLSQDNLVRLWLWILEPQENE